MTPPLRKLLALTALSTAAQAAHDVAVDQGDSALAASLHKMGEEISRLVGGVVVAESKRRALEATS